MSRKSRKFIVPLVGIIGLIIITIGVTFAFFNYAKEGTTENSITTGTITFLYTEIDANGAGISVEDAFPMSDELGKAQTGDTKVFNFKVTATTPKASIAYEVTARKKADSTLDDSVVKLYLTEVSGNQETELLLDNYSNLTQTSISIPENTIEKTIYTDTVPANSNYEKNFRLRMWIDEDTDFSDGSMNNKTFTVTINVYANAEVVSVPTGPYTEALLNGADPVLTDNLVPVMIASDGTVTKADTDEEWYSYETKNWANAVVLKDTSISYDNGDTIPETNIESYFVWIPRYKYKIFNTGSYTALTSIGNSEQEIEVVFENKETTASTGTAVNDYLTHPAFLAFDTNGLWVGKFETGYDGATTTATAQVNSSDSSKVIIKPNVYSWRNLTVGNMFDASYNYLRNDESHMMKNTEWGAVAYLQHSAYGSQGSLRINNNSSFITGYAATEEPTKGYNEGVSIAGNRVEGTAIATDGTYTVNYLNSLSNVASTTGNKSGVYDMSGGAWEYVMGYTTGATTVGGSSGITTLHSDFFTNSSWNKYYDKYTSTVNTNYNNRILGDATGEMGPFGSQVDPDGNTRYKSSWYGDYAHFANSAYPWFDRGGNWHNGTYAGAFAFGYNTGGAYAFISFRVVLAP